MGTEETTKAEIPHITQVMGDLKKPSFIYVRYEQDPLSHQKRTKIREESPY